MSTTSVGLAAEQAVSEELQRQGFEILERNWKTKYCEVDIIARKSEVIWFIEVKYRKTTKFGDGLEYIGPSKLRHMQTAAQLWVTMNNYAAEFTLGAVSLTDNHMGELIEISI